MFPSRKDFIKGYILAIITENGATNIVDVSSKVMTAFAIDLPAALGEMAEVIMQQNGNSIGAAILGKVNDFIGEIGSRGIKSVWADLQDQYKRGAEVKARRK